MVDRGSRRNSDDGYVGGELCEKNLTTGQETKRYDLGDTLVATKVGGTLSSTYQDYLHSTVSASNGSAVEYSPYGLVKASTGTLPTDHQFQGQQDQSSVGLYHMGDRWYDPTIGLWTQPDSLVPNVLDPLSLNHYGFVEGNPLRYWDPSGHECNDPSGVDNDATCETGAGAPGGGPVVVVNSGQATAASSGGTTVGDVISSAASKVVGFVKGLVSGTNQDEPEVPPEE